MSGSGSPDSSLLDENVKPGEYVLQNLFLAFCNLSEKKIELVLAEPLVSSKSKLVFLDMLYFLLELCKFLSFELVYDNKEPTW